VRSARRSRFLPPVAFVLGIVFTGAGFVLLGIYVAGVIEILIDRPADRSWLFWGLGVAFMGIIQVVGGVALVVVWRRTRPGSDPD